MKKLFLITLLMTLAASAKAQFEEETYFVNTSLTSFDFSYSGSEKARFGLQGSAGYFLYDDIALVANVGADIRNNSFRELTVGGGGRYYIEQNGLYLGAGLQFVHARRSDNEKHFNDFMPYAEIGYAYFLNKYLTVEPAVYYRQSLHSHSDFSKIGIKVGLGFYF